MDLLRVALLLLFAQLFEFCYSRTDEFQSITKDNDVLRKTLEKEVLKHTIQFLRTKLVKCLKTSRGPGRQKRKSGGHVTWMLEHEVDMDLMNRTKDYLMSRIVDCRRQSSSNYRGNDGPSLGEGIIKAGNHQSEANDKLVARQFPATRPPQTTRDETPQPPRPESTTQRNQGNTGSGRAVGPSSGIGSEKNPDRNALHPLLSLATTTQKPAESRTFIIDGREVSCKSMSLSTDHSTLFCGDVWIDKKYRLPNSDLCLPRFGTEPVWRQLKHIQKNTFRLLDLEGFCQALADANDIHGYVNNLRVSWDCEENETRIKWLNDQWAGHVVDNGFLHDLECKFDTFT